MNEPIARRYVVTGRVQGVGYRRFAQQAAGECGVSGWARNLDDGSVEAFVIGTASQVAAMAGMLRRGPAWADVRTVLEEEAAMLELKGFRIR
ncbi:MAG: acylphosphatase [Bryobacteraceae bacterium]